MPAEPVVPPLGVGVVVKPQDIHLDRVEVEQRLASGGHDRAQERPVAVGGSA